jgi:DNA polymerase-3 subunit chi
MTEIHFYFHVEDRLHTACALSAKAYSKGLRVYAFCSDAETGRKFDRMLWSTPATGFIPHCATDDKLAAVTSVIFGHQEVDPPHDEVLVNLRQALPPFFSRFRRLIEIVCLDEDDRRLARERFKFYRDRGYEIHSHDMSEHAQ